MKLFFGDVYEILRFALDDIATTRMFRRELQRKYFISRLSELPEGLKAVWLKCVIEVPAEA